MEKDIFRTLKHYSRGFHRGASAEEKKAYDAKVADLTERIRADVEHAPEIIAEEFGKYEVKKYRAAFSTGINLLIEVNAEWKAIDNVMMALSDTKPLKDKR